MIILIHTSKTMRPYMGNSSEISEPEFLAEATMLQKYLSTLGINDIIKLMNISRPLAQKVSELYKVWDTHKESCPAVDSFLGDIYSGLQANSWSVAERKYANHKLRIISGLYGILRPLDGIRPYRLEMGYKVNINNTNSLYDFWNNKLLSAIPDNIPVVDLTAAEYSKVLKNHPNKANFITPKFLTTDTATGEPKFVVVHAKIARGAFASWIIKNRVESVSSLKNFNQLGYSYSPKFSTQKVPVFICEEFGGIGLSIRLS